LVSDDQGSNAMADDAKGKASAESLTAAEQEHKELMAALLKKLDVLSSLEDRLGRIEHAQKQMTLHTQGPSSSSSARKVPSATRASTS